MLYYYFYFVSSKTYFANIFAPARKPEFNFSQLVCYWKNIFSSDPLVMLQDIYQELCIFGGNRQSIIGIRLTCTYKCSLISQITSARANTSQYFVIIAFCNIYSKCKLHNETAFVSS